MVSLLFGKKYPKTRIGIIDLDASLSESHEFPSTITQFPVENGGTISDHIVNNPIRLSLECLVSDSPLPENANPLSVAFNSISSLISPNRGPTRSNTVLDQLVTLYQKREPITVVTSIQQYPNMCISNISIPRNANTGQALIFRIDLIQVRFASTVDLTYRNPAIIQNESPPIIREQIGDNSNFPLFAQDPAGSLKDQAQSFIDVGTQRLQDIKPQALDVAQSVFNRLSQSGIFNYG